MKKLFLLTTLFAVSLSMSAQRATDKLDRGLVAVPGQSGGNFVSWKIFGEEYYDTEYNLYRNGQLLNSSPLKISSFNDAGGNASSKYSVAPVVKGVEQTPCAEVTRWANQYFDIPVAAVTDRSGNNVTAEYFINDMSLADVDGDGKVEFIIKRNFSGDILNASNKTKFHHLECYNLKGERLWWIDCGPNLMAGPDEQWDIIAFDWDQDGKAEALMRGADNMVIHTATGKTINVGNMDYYAPRTEYTRDGAEYLLYLNGETGEPYLDWDGGNAWTPMAYPLPRFESGESDYATVWGKNDTGHRSSKHYFGAPYFDGRNPSIFLGRGCYTRHKMCALDVDPATHKLTQRWRWNEYSGSSPWFGNGFHNFAIADVDWDGRDEIVFGSMIIDDNGKGLCTTGLGHGDAQHCSDLDPYRHGQEQFTCNETSPACTYYNATTGQIYYRLASTGDDGRALCANFSNKFPGSLGRTTQSGLVSTVADKVIEGGPATGGTNDALFWSHLNQRVYWDGDLCDEVFDSPGSEARQGAVYKPDGGRLITFEGTNTSNSSKNNPGAIADIFGDWREEVVMRSGDAAIRIFTTNIPTNYGFYTLWHDHQYRNSMVWQSVGYNQPPHKSYFIGEMEGITIAPPPFTTVGRTIINDGGTISSANNDQHVLVCETADSKITVADGSKPYIATFNVPSWVQGTNSPLLNGKAKINYQYFTCDVTGGAFAGNMRLIKQGDGILNLPKVDMTYTGETNIWAGTVNFDGTMKNSAVWLNRFAELNSNGGEFKSIKIDYDSKLRPGRADNMGSITTGELQLGFGSRVIFDLYCKDLKADEVKTNILTIETKDWQYGPKYLTPVFEFVLHDAENGEVAEGKYLIGEVTTVNGNLRDIKMEGLGTEKKSELVLEEGKLYLVISAVRGAGSVVWNGLVSSTWQMAGEGNFTNAADTTSTNDIFVSGDFVRFNDTASQFKVSLKGDIEADTIEVDNTKAYTFEGTGSIIGNSVLVKKGKGTLTINTDNSYTGGTRISGGRLSVKALANSNQAMGNLGSMNTTAAKFVMENGGELYTTAAVTQGSPMRMEGEEGGVVNNLMDFIVAKTISGTVLTKKGTGWMKLNVNNSALDRMIIAGGTVQCVNASMPAKTVEYQGGTLRENTTSSYQINVPKGKQGAWYLANRSTYTNKLTGEGTLTIYCVTEKGTNYYATRTPIQCNFTDFEGTIKATSSEDDPAVLRFTLNSGGGLPKGTLNVAAGVEIQNTAKTFRIGKLTGAGALGGNCSFDKSAVTGSNNWNVGNDENWSSTVKVTSNANLVKVGSGRVAWNAANDNTGSTTVKEGELAVSTTTKLGTGMLTVAANAMLTGNNNAYNPLANSSVKINGTIRPGLLESSTVGKIFFDNKNVTISETGTLVITANKNGNSTSLEGVDKLEINGTICINAIRLHTFAVGDSIRLWNANSFTGTPTFEMLNGVTWDTSRISEGILIVKEIDYSSINSVARDVDARNIYDLSGRLVRRNATNTQGLPAGIYVRGGRKIVVK